MADLSTNSSETTAVKKRSSTRFVLLFVLVAALLAVTLTSLYAPSAISWWFEPPAGFGISCAPSISWALDRMLKIQLTSLAVGAFLGLVFGIKLKSKAY